MSSGLKLKLCQLESASQPRALLRVLGRMECVLSNYYYSTSCFDSDENIGTWGMDGELVRFSGMSPTEIFDLLLKGNKQLTIQGRSPTNLQVELLVHQKRGASEKRVAVLSTQDGLQYRKLCSVLHENGIAEAEFGVAVALAVGAKSMMSHCVLSDFEAAIEGRLPQGITRMPGVFLGLPQDVNEGLRNLPGGEFAVAYETPLGTAYGYKSPGLTKRWDDIWDL